MRIHFEFHIEGRATHYTVVNTSEGSVLLNQATYKWTLTPPAGDQVCDNHLHGGTAGTGNEFVWYHGSEGDPISDDGCAHDGPSIGPQGHLGTVSVEVNDGFDVCTASYTGTQRADGNASGDGPDGDCVSIGSPPPPPAPPPPPPPPPPPVTSCRCMRLTARIVPSSVGFSPGHRSDEREISFTVHWVLLCSKGGGGCRGELGVGLAKSRAAPLPRSKVFFRCDGRCGEARDGRKEFRVEAKAYRHFISFWWKNVRVPLVIERYCQRRKLRPVNLWIAFDETGTKIDLKASKLS